MNEEIRLQALLTFLIKRIIKKRTTREGFFYVFFLASTTAVVFLTHLRTTTDTLHMNSALRERKLTRDFLAISDAESFWSWLHTFAESSPTHYPTSSSPSADARQPAASTIIPLPTVVLRQYRVKPVPCSTWSGYKVLLGGRKRSTSVGAVPPTYLPKDCYGAYSDSTADTAPFGKHGEWVSNYMSMQNSTSPKNSQFRLYQVEGTVAGYRDASHAYVTTLDLFGDTIPPVMAVKRMKDNRFIDVGTRAIIISVIWYSPPIQIFVLETLQLEVTQAGLFKTKQKTKPFSYVALNWSTPIGKLVFALDVAVAIFAVVGYFQLISNFRHTYKLTLSIVSTISVWQLVTLLYLLAITYNCLLRAALWKNAFDMGALHGVMDVECEGGGCTDTHDDDNTINVSHITSWNYLMDFSMYYHSSTILWSIIMCLMWFRVFHFVQYNDRLNALTETLKQASGYLVGLAILSFCILFAWSLMGVILFGFSVASYGSIGTAMGTLLRSALGEWFEEDYKQTLDVQPVLAPLFQITFYGIFWLILLNMILAVITGSYSLVMEAVQTDIEPMKFLTTSWDSFRHAFFYGKLGQSVALCCGRDRNKVTDIPGVSVSPPAVPNINDSVSPPHESPVGGSPPPPAAAPGGSSPTSSASRSDHNVYTPNTNISTIPPSPAPYGIEASPLHGVRLSASGVGPTTPNTNPNKLGTSGNDRFNPLSPTQSLPHVSWPNSPLQQRRSTSPSPSNISAHSSVSFSSKRSHISTAINKVIDNCAIAQHQKKEHQIKEKACVELVHQLQQNFGKLKGYNNSEAQPQQQQQQANQTYPFSKKRKKLAAADSEQQFITKQKLKALCPNLDDWFIDYVFNEAAFEFIGVQRTVQMGERLAQHIHRRVTNTENISKQLIGLGTYLQHIPSIANTTEHMNQELSSHTQQCIRSFNSINRLLNTMCSDVTNITSLVEPITPLLETNHASIYQALCSDITTTINTILNTLNNMHDTFRSTTNNRTTDDSTLMKYRFPVNEAVEGATSSTSGYYEGSQQPHDNTVTSVSDMFSPTYVLKPKNGSSSYPNNINNVNTPTTGVSRKDSTVCSNTPGNRMLSFSSLSRKPSMSSMNRTGSLNSRWWATLKGLGTQSQQQTQSQPQGNSGGGGSGGIQLGGSGVQCVAQVLPITLPHLQRTSNNSTAAVGVDIWRDDNDIINCDTTINDDDDDQSTPTTATTDTTDDNDDHVHPSRHLLRKQTHQGAHSTTTQSKMEYTYEQQHQSDQNDTFEGCSSQRILFPGGNGGGDVLRSTTVVAIPTNVHLIPNCMDESVYSGTSSSPSSIANANSPIRPPSATTTGVGSGIADLGYATGAQHKTAPCTPDRDFCGLTSVDTPTSPILLLKSVMRRKSNQQNNPLLPPTLQHQLHNISNITFEADESKQGEGMSAPPIASLTSVQYQLRSPVWRDEGAGTYQPVLAGSSDTPHQNPC